MSFESSSVTVQLSHSNLSVFNIYRPPSSSTHFKPFSVFLDDFSSFISSATMCAISYNVRCSFRSTCVKALQRDEQNFARLLHAAVLSHRHAGRIALRKRIDRLMIRYFVFFFFFPSSFWVYNGLVTLTARQRFRRDQPTCNLALSMHVGHADYA